MRLGIHVCTYKISMPILPPDGLDTQKPHSGSSAISASKLWGLGG